MYDLTIYRCITKRLQQPLKLLQDFITNFLAPSLSAKVACPETDTTHIGRVQHLPHSQLELVGQLALCEGPSEEKGDREDCTNRVCNALSGNVGCLTRDKSARWNPN